ncbi:MAG: DEAD/DEAH box helicase, partial [bacterium]
GWNSWRVSTMGLMNVGSTEGSQIIQLFGRGVRLKGYLKSLKRSGKVQLPEEIKRPSHIRILETLSIFGIKADYMAQFREFLEEEGLPPNDERIEFLLPVIRNLGSKQLKIIRLKKTINGVSTEFGDAFKKLGPIPSLVKPDPATDPSTRYLQENQVVLNWYPKIQALKSRDATGGEQEDRPNEGHLSELHVAFLDYDALYFEIIRYKAERAWHNLNISREKIQALLLDQSWYRLLIPENELALDSFEKVRLWQEIAEALLKKYCERYYSFRKKEWELPHLEYRYIDESDPNFPPANDDYGDGYYRILIEESQEEIIAKLKELKDLIATGQLRPWEFGGLKAIWFGQHLYEPLLHLSGTVVEISPVALNKGERTFVDDLKDYYATKPDLIKGKELYLLRNLSRGRGVGFFEAGNFHPDFIVWVLEDRKQFVSFVDPKGIRNIGRADPKIEFYRTIKEIEGRLGDSDVILNSFIISNTPSHTMKLLWDLNKSEMEFRNILFQEEDKAQYIGSMLSKILKESATEINKQ